MTEFSLGGSLHGRLLATPPLADVLCAFREYERRLDRHRLFGRSTDAARCHDPAGPGGGSTDHQDRSYDGGEAVRRLPAAKDKGH